MSNNYAQIPILDRMSSLMDAIINSPDGLRAIDLLHSESIPKTTLYRLLASMSQNGFLTYMPETGVYTLGPKFTAYYVYMDERANHLREVALPHMQTLANHVRQTVKLTILSGMKSYTVASVEGDSPVRVSIDPGAVFPLHAGASGKILMCGMSHSAIARYYQLHGVQYTNATIMSIEQMEQQLEEVRARGYAIDIGEWLPEISAIAAPVKGASGQILASLSVPFPTISWDYIDAQDLAVQIIEAAAAIGIAYTSRETRDRQARLVQEQL